jgi:hypothetical protein
MANLDNPLTIRLARDAGIEVNSGAWARLRVKSGDVWITYPGSGDLIVSKGECIELPKRSWVMAMSNSRIELSGLKHSAGSWASRWLRKLEAAYARSFESRIARLGDLS